MIRAIDRLFSHPATKQHGNATDAAIPTRTNSITTRKKETHLAHSEFNPTGEPDLSEMRWRTQLPFEHNTVKPGSNSSLRTQQDEPTHCNHPTSRLHTSNISGASWFVNSAVPGKHLSYTKANPQTSLVQSCPESCQQTEKRSGIDRQGFKTVLSTMSYRYSNYLLQQRGWEHVGERLEHTAM